MTRSRTIRQSMEQLRRSIEQTVREAARSGRGRRVNVASRRNVIVTANVGREGAVQGASASQYAPIDQHGDEGREQGG